MKLADIFGNNMVLQRNRKISIFGEGEGKGSVELNGARVDFVSVNGKFKAYLPEMNAGGPYEMKVTLNGKTELFTDIMIGDVYIAGGQSNMQFEVWEATDIFPQESNLVRYFKECNDGDKYINNTPFYKKEVWQKATNETSAHFSAIGFAFALALAEKTGVTVGIISCCQGASRVDAWTDPIIVNTPEYQSLMPEKHYDYDNFKFNHESWLYKNKLMNIMPYSVSGVLFYQGESNTGIKESGNYSKLFEYMVNNWRECFENEFLPFYCVQIMPFEADPHLANWAKLRKQQETASKTIPNTYLVTMANTGESKLIHPTRKKDIAQALANTVLNTRFGEKVEYSGPIAENANISENKITIAFSHSEGLCISGNYLDGAYFCDENGILHTPKAETTANTLVLTFKEDVKIKTVALGWENAPRHNLYNSAGYLASPFKFEF